MSTYTHTDVTFFGIAGFLHDRQSVVVVIERNMATPRAKSKQLSVMLLNSFNVHPFIYLNIL